MDSEDVAVGFFVLELQVRLRAVVPEPSGIDAKHIDTRRALYHPFGQLPAGAAGCCDTEAVAFVEPEVFPIPGWTDDGAAVRRVANSAVVDFLDANFAKGGYAVDGGLDMGFQALQVFLEQFVLTIVGGSVPIADGRAFLIRAED